MGRARRLRRLVSRALLEIGCRVLPRLYVAYMGFVWRTSQIEDDGLAKLHGILAREGRAVGLLWHEEVIGAPYAYAWLGFRPHTLASTSNAGELVTRLLERCGFAVLRGGASRGRSRRRGRVWRQMIDQLRQGDGVLYAVAVDGSRGPVYGLKRGPLVVARHCGAPLVLVRCWYARCLRLPTWDRSALPLPWNRIRYSMRGPYRVPASARSRGDLESLRGRLEIELRALAAESYAALGQAPPEGLRLGHES